MIQYNYNNKEIITVRLRVFFFSWPERYPIFCFFLNFSCLLEWSCFFTCMNYDAAWTNWTQKHFKSWYTDFLVKYVYFNFSSVSVSLHKLQLFHVLFNKFHQFLLFDYFKMNMTRVSHFCLPGLVNIFSPKPLPS